MLEYVPSVLKLFHVNKNLARYNLQNCAPQTENPQELDGFIPSCNIQRAEYVALFHCCALWKCLEDGTKAMSGRPKTLQRYTRDGYDSDRNHKN